MKRTFLAATAVGAFALAGMAFSGNAQAQCYWTGIDWACPGSTYQQPFYGYPSYGYTGYGWTGSGHPRPFSDLYHPGPPLTGSKN